MPLSANSDGTYTDPLNGILSGAGSLTQLIQQLVGGKTQSSSNQNTLQSAATTSTGTNSSTTTSPLALQSLDQLLPMLQQQMGSSDFSKQSAINDAQGGVQLILKNLKEQSIPGLFSAEAAQGGYNSTTKGLLANDLAARAAAQGQGLITDTVSKYATTQNQQTANLIAAIRTAADANKTTTGSTTDNKFSQGETNVATIGDNTNKGVLQNPLAQLLGGGVGAYSLLQAIGPSGFSSLAKLFGFGNAVVNPDGTINWGDATGIGDQGGWPGDTSGSDFTGPDIPIGGDDIFGPPDDLFDPGDLGFFDP